MIIVFRIQVMIISDLVLINMTLVFLLSSLVVLVSLWYVARIHYNNLLVWGILNLVNSKKQEASAAA